MSILTNKRNAHWKALKKNELLITSADNKLCTGCMQILPANLTNFGRSCIKKREQFRLVYLRPKCRKCFKQKSQAPIERRREISRNHYHANKEKKNKQNKLFIIKRKLNKHFGILNEKNKWKTNFNNVLEKITKL